MSKQSAFGAPIFIISPTKRAGTNFLKNILCQHRDCFSPGPIWEDELLRKAHLLRDYIDFTFQKWNPSWEVEKELCARDKAMSLLGDGLIDMLHMQFSNSQEKLARFEPRGPEAPYRYVTKTPKADNIQLFAQLFPSAKLLILVRDGKSVVQSGQTSFSKPFDLAVREWSAAMRNIETFVKSDAFDPNLHRLVRYEDLITDAPKVLTDLLSFLDLDADGIDPDAVDEMPVIGSSTIKQDGQEVHWTPTKKDASFDPLKRADGWSSFKRSHYAFLSGDAGVFAGYAPPEAKGAYAPLHAAKSAAWWPVWKLWQVAKTAREDLKRCLSRMTKS